MQALASVLYDLHNDIGLSASLGPKQAEKNLLFAQHLDALQAGDVVVGDRAYAGYGVLATLVARQCHFVIRFPRQDFALVNAFWAAQAPEQVVTMAVTSKSQASVAKHHWPTILPLRLIKVRLATGEVEVVGTDLLDAQIYPAAEFKEVYGWR